MSKSKPRVPGPAPGTDDWSQLLAELEAAGPSAEPAAAPGRRAQVAAAATPVVILGIDPGLDGGLAWVDAAGLVPARAVVTPTVSSAGKGKGKGKRQYDIPAMIGLLRSVPVRLAVIEQVGAMPKQGVTSMFNFGLGYGLWLGLLAALAIPVQPVPPPTWKAKVLAGTKRDKQAAIVTAGRLFPGVTLRATPRCTTPHDGLADALCLAEYGRRFLLGI